MRLAARPLTPNPSPARGEGSALQRAVPIRVVDVDLPHLRSMFARVAHQLRGRVEAERLGIEHRGEEDVGITAFHPAGGVDEQCETRRVALGKTIFAEPLDLPEAALGE